MRAGAVWGRARMSSRTTAGETAWPAKAVSSRALVCMPPAVRREACVIHYFRRKVGTHSEIDGVEPDLISQVPEPATVRIRTSSSLDLRLSLRARVRV